MLTGHLPFEGTFQEVYEKQLHEKLPLKDVEDKTVRKIIEKATEKDQKKRYQSASEFRVDIDNWMTMDSGNDGIKRVTLDIKIPQPKPIYKKVVLIVATVAIIIAASVLIIKNLPPKSDNYSNRTTEASSISSQTLDNHEKPLEKPKNKKSVSDKELTIDQYRDLVLKGDKSGMDGILNLAEKGDYAAFFLLSRIYFDPENVANIGFYNEEWTTIRDNFGITPDNVKAHNYLMSGYQTEMGKNDIELLYELGCDFMYKGRGVDTDWGKARTCFEKVYNLANDDSPYKDAAADRIKRIGKTPAKPIE